jgi:hypothetical protein
MSPAPRKPRRMPRWLRDRIGRESGSGRLRTLTTIRDIDDGALTPYSVSSGVGIERATVVLEELVRRLLPDAVDEGTATAMDALIESWAADWLASVDRTYVENVAEIDRLLVAVCQQRVLAESALDNDERALELVRLDYHAARVRIGEEVPKSTGGAAR